MANASTAPANTATEAVNEAARIAAEASRRTAEAGRASVEVARTYLDDSSAAAQRFFQAYAAGAEAALKGAFEVQNAALAAGLTVFDAGVKTNRGLLDQYETTLRQAQQAALEAFQAAARAGEETLIKTTAAVRTK